MPIPLDASFAETLARYVTRCGYTYGQLARISGLPKRTLAHWLEGIVERPRDWRDLIRVAAALHLDEAEVDRLLQSARHVGVVQLLAQADCEPDRCLLAPWAEALQRRLLQSPFQAVADLPYFVGRSREAKALRQILLGEQANKLCSLHGMGGAGKTALAAHLAYELRAYFPDGILWARLDNSDTVSILHSFARTYGLDLSNYKDVESCSRAVRELLAHKRALMVLDNAESSAQVEPLLPPSGTCAVLLTSRRHDLAVARGAHRFQLGPFERSEDSLALFEKVLGVEIVHERSETFLAIAELLGYLPLALDIAASRMANEPGWSSGDFLDRLRREENRLSQLVYENQSVQLSFNVSYQALPAEQQHLFCALGVFGGEDFSREAIGFVAGLGMDAAADQMRKLYALSLVRLSRLGRYQLHPLLRELAFAHGVGDESYQRMVAFYVRYIQEHQEVYPALDLEIANILFALQVAFERDMGALLVEGIDALVAYLEARGLYHQAELHLDRAVTLAHAPAARTQAALLCKLGLTLLHAGRLADGENRLRDGLRVARNAGAAEDIVCLLLGYLGLLAYYRSDYGQMEDYLQQALHLARVSHQREAICRLLDGLNETAQRRGDYATAEAYCREGLALARQLENQEMISMLLKSLASVLFEKGGEIGEIERCLQESLAVARQLGHRRVICLSLLSSAYIACGLGHYQAAEAQLRQALDLADEIDVPVERTFIISTLGLAAHGRGMYAQARTYLQDALGLARRVGVTVLIAPIQNAWGWLDLRQEAWESADRAFSEALALSRQSGSRAQVGQALFGLAQVCAAQNNLLAARQYAAESLAVLNEIGHRTRRDVQAWLSELG